MGKGATRAATRFTSFGGTRRLFWRRGLAPRRSTGRCSATQGPTAFTRPLDVSRCATSEVVAGWCISSTSYAVALVLVTRPVISGTREASGTHRTAQRVRWSSGLRAGSSGRSHG